MVAQIQARVVRNPANKVLGVPGGEGEVVYEDDPSYRVTPVSRTRGLA